MGMCLSLGWLIEESEPRVWVMPSATGPLLTKYFSRTVLDYPIAGSPPSVQSLARLVVDAEQGKSLEVSPVIEISSSRILFHQKHGNLVFLLPCTSLMPVMIPFEFINRFAEVLEKYFTPPIVPMRIETNLDTVSLLLNEMLDDGFPYVTEPDALRDLVPSGGLLSKILSGGSKVPPTQSNIPWRRSNVRHTNNELFIDLVETLYLVLPAKDGRSGKRAESVAGSSAFYSHSNQPSASFYTTRPLISRIEGTIFVTSNLSGIPEIALNLNVFNNRIGRPSFHPCVKIDKWIQSPGTLQFIPPDGKSLIGSYTLDNNSISSGGGKNNRPVQGQGLVFAELRTHLGVAKDEFEARVWTIMSREVKNIEGLSVNIVCDSMNSGKNVKGLRITSGDFHFNDSGIGEWTFPGKTPLGWNASLRGVLERVDDEEEEEEAEEEERAEVDVNNESKNHEELSTSPYTTTPTVQSDYSKRSPDSTKDKKPIFPTHLSVTYTLTGSVPSGIKVHSLRILKSPGLGDGVKPFKGLRYTTHVGEYIVR